MAKQFSRKSRYFNLFFKKNIMIWNNSSLGWLLNTLSNYLVKCYPNHSTKHTFDESGRVWQEWVQLWHHIIWYEYGSSIMSPLKEFLLLLDGGLAWCCRVSASGPMHMVADIFPAWSVHYREWIWLTGWWYGINNERDWLVLFAGDAMINGNVLCLKLF